MESDRGKPGHNGVYLGGSVSSTVGQAWATKLRLAFNGSNGSKILKSFAALLIDKAIDWGSAGLSARFAIQDDGTPAETAALALQASERQLQLDPAATAAFSANCIQNAQVLWHYAGTPIGMCLGFYIANLGRPLVVQQNGLSTQINAGTVNFADLVGAIAPPSWISITTLANANPALPASTDGRPAVAALTVPWWTFDAGMDGAGNQYCSRFGIVYPPFSTLPDYTVANTLNRARAVIAGWKPAHAKCMGIWESVSGRMWGTPGAIWGSGVWGGVNNYYIGEV